MSRRVVIGMAEQMGDEHLFVPQRRQRPEIVAKAGYPGELAIGV